MMRRHRRFAVCAASLMAVASIAIPGIAGATTAATKAPKPDMGYFAGKTLTLIEPSVPAPLTIASGADVAQFLDTYLHATVNVQYVAINGVIGGTNEAAAAPPNGLTIGFTALNSSLISLVTGPDAFTFSFKKLEWLGAFGASPAAIVSCNPAITSWSQLIKRKTPVTILGPAASSQLIRGELLSKMFNFPATVLTGFPSSAALLTGCQQGDGDLAVLAFSQTLNAAGTAFAPGFTPFLSTGSLPKTSSAYRLFASLPTLDSYVAQHPLKTKTEKLAFATNAALASQAAPTTGYFLPPNTPMPYVLALRAALAAAYKNSTVKQAIADVPDPNILLSANAITTWLNASLKTYGPFIEKMTAAF